MKERLNSVRETILESLLEMVESSQSSASEITSDLKPGSQYDAGAASVTSFVSVTEKKSFFTSQIASLTLNFWTI